MPANWAFGWILKRYWRYQRYLSAVMVRCGSKVDPRVWFDS
jgi:hypothetical protein